MLTLKSKSTLKFVEYLSNIKNISKPFVAKQNPMPKTISKFFNLGVFLRSNW